MRVQNPRNTTSRWAACRSIVITQLAGFGDMVLTSQLVASLQAALPDAAITVMARPATSPLAALYPVKPASVVAFDASSAHSKHAGEKPDLVIAAEYQPSAISIHLTESLGGTVVHASDHSRQVPQSWEGPRVEPEMHILDRYDAIAEFLGGTATRIGWTLPERAVQGANAILQPAGIDWKRYLVVTPCGAPGVTAKRWPLANFAAVVSQLESSLPIVILGSSEEYEELRALEVLIGPGRPLTVFSGDANDIEACCGLVAGARAYFGLDTGPMHLAAMYGVPSVSIYGGGHWPIYSPWAAGAIGLVEELPCFGCGWDCVLGHGMCVEAIPIEAGVQALRDVLGGVSPAPPEIRRVRTVPDAVHPVLRDASARYRESQRDRAKRLEALVNLGEAVTREQGTAYQFQQIADERLEALRQVTGAHDRVASEAAKRLDALKQMTEAYDRVASEAAQRETDVKELTRQVKLRDDRIAHLQMESADRLTALNVQSEALQQLREEACTRARHLDTFTAIVAEREQSIECTRKTAAERLAALLDLDAAYKTLQTDSEKRLDAIHELTNVIAERDAAIRAYQEAAAEQERALASLLIEREEVRSRAATQLAEAETREGRLSHLITLLESQIEESSKRAESLETQNTVLRGQLEVHQSRIDELERQNLYRFLVRKLSAGHKTTGVQS